MSMFKVRPDPSVGGLTRQSEADACDVNLIIAKHRRGAITSHVMQKVGDYAFAPAMDFRECMEQVRQAKEAFAALPAVTRRFFHDDPGEFVSYVAKPEDRAKLLELGLMIPKEVPAPPLGSAENPIHTAPSAPGGSETGAGGTPARP